MLTTLADSRNMHVAARQMHLSQPAASKMLKDLEGFFGFEIFMRQPRAMVLTELGAHVVRHARILLNDAGRLVEEIDALRQGGYGQLIIGAIPAAAPEILPAALAELKHRRPRLAISFQEQSSDRLLIDLEYKRLDLVIGRLTSSDQHNLFDFEPLREEPLRIVVRSGHPLLDSEPSLEELSHWPWVLHPSTSPMRGVFETALAEAGIASPTSVVETTSTQTALQLLKISDMLAVLPRSVLRSPLAAGQYQTLPLVVGEPLDYYGIITRKGEPISSAASELVTALRSQGSLEHDASWL
ncbi:LysR family transcriptional regulator [Modicisalibacter ilicicola]|uniref:LysR family transcriptional regulator n=1 Tax=Modicisalibacter ilicicola TaxID=480814 RepID=UPI001FE534A7